jgi:hypothetical protein
VLHFQSWITYVRTTGTHVGRFLPDLKKHLCCEPHGKGSLKLAPRRRGPATWEYRWREYGPRGNSVYKCMTVGTVEQFPHKVSAAQAVAGLQRQLNRAEPRSAIGLSVADLVQHFTQRELHADERSFSTKRGYQQYLKSLGWSLSVGVKLEVDASTDSTELQRAPNGPALVGLCESVNQNNEITVRKLRQPGIRKSFSIRLRMVAREGIGRTTHFENT